MLELNSVPVRLVGNEERIGTEQIGPIPFSDSLPTVAPAIVFVCFC